MSYDIEAFVQQLVDSGVMSSSEVEAFQKSISPDRRLKDAQEFARELVRAGKLTKYQAAVVYQGKAKALFRGQYVVLDRIGSGGMGRVFKAKHRRLDHIVALKILTSRANRSPPDIKRFLREVQAIAKLEHPNIVAAYDAGEHEGLHYLVMEFVDACDLSSPQSSVVLLRLI
jgi:serine/threonine protein kinase